MPCGVFRCISVDFGVFRCISVFTLTPIPANVNVGDNARDRIFTFP